MIICKYYDLKYEEINGFWKKRENSYLITLLMKNFKCLNNNELRKRLGISNNKSLYNKVKIAEEKILINKRFREEYFELEEKIKENFAEEFSKELPSANNILDNKAAETGVQREQVMRLEKQVENLQAAVEKSSRPAEREEIILKVSEERAKSVKTEIIAGVRYVMIPAETGVKMKVNDREFE